MNRLLKIVAYSMLFSICVASPYSWSANSTVEEKKSPSVFFPEPSYEFESAVDGVDVLHDFVIMNRGTDILQVQKVKTG